MPRYIVRFREVCHYQTAVDAASYKEAFAAFKEKLANKTFTPKPDMLGLSYEIETITLGSSDDNQSKGITDQYQRTKSD